MSAPRAPSGLYCPGCGQRLSRRVTGWTCAGELHEFPDRAGQMLVDRFAASFSPARKPAYPPQPGRWFCPACCVPMGSDHVCPECGGTFRGALLHLLHEQ